MTELIIMTGAVLYLTVLLALRRGFRRQESLPHLKDLPSVSVVISLHNEERNIEPLIGCLEALDYPAGKLEFILINDRSTDRTGEILHRSGERIKNAKVIDITAAGADFAPKKFAIDQAVRQAAGEIILLTDADGRPGKNWVTGMVEQFTEDTGLVLGHAPYTVPDTGKSLIRQLLKIEYFSHAAIAAATAGLGYPITGVGTNLAYRKAVFLELDGFGRLRHIHTGDDDLFLQRVRDETAWQIRYAFDPGTFVPNAPPADWRQFHHQRLRYASKGFIYPKKITLALTAFYFFNLAILMMLLFAIPGVFSVPIAALVMVIKLLSDFLFLKTASSAFRYPVPDLLIPFASLLHTPYVLYFGLMANIRRFEWGGIKNRAGG